LLRCAWRHRAPKAVMRGAAVGDGPSGHDRPRRDVS
jgi:hypothetical protein